MKKIEFYFDFLSPYSYLAWTWVRDQMKNQEKNKTIGFDFYPIPMASLITHYETKGPAQIEPKRNYLFKDLLRKTKLHNIPFTTPKELPFNSLYALRLALLGVSGEKQQTVIDAIFTAGWEQGMDIGNDDVLKTILKDLVPAVSEIFEKMENKEARRELKQNLERAIENKLFGVPSFLVGNKDKDEKAPELFWGYDSIPFLTMYLNNQDPLDHHKYETFLKLFPRG